MKPDQANPVSPGEAQRQRQRAKNWAMFAALAAFALLVYLIAIVRMGGG
ncbi:MAG: hypothetical protein ACKVOI_10705 [Dongiaceae bacterium]